jgi:REP element-mobilizing transposase RayT
MHSIPIAYPHFFTATILQWRKLLQTDKYKDIIDSLRYMVSVHRVISFGFVIMNDLILLIWQMKAGHLYPHVQWDLLKYNAQQIKWGSLVA